MGERESVHDCARAAGKYENKQNNPEYLDIFVWTFLGEYFYLESYITCLVALVMKLKIIKQIQKYLI